LRLDRVDLLEDSAKVLKKYLPKMSSLSEFEQSEIFSVYSLLKYLAMEFRHHENYFDSSTEAFMTLNDRIMKDFLQNGFEDVPIDLSGDGQLINMLEFIYESDLSKEMKDRMTDHFIQYFNSVNQAELRMFKA